MRTRSAVLSLTLAVVLASVVYAAPRRRAAGPSVPAAPSSSDVLGMGTMSGAAVSGTADSVQGTVITLKTGSAPDVRIEAANAKIAGDMGQLISVAEIVPGSRIAAFIAAGAILPPGAPLPARFIAVESLPDLSVTGPVDSIDVAHSKFTILGIEITADANTSYATSFPTFAAIDGLEDFSAGQIVRARITVSGSTLLATSVLVVSPGPTGGESIFGTVQSISATSWVIATKDGKEVTVLVDDQTKIVGNPKAGDTVQVFARVDLASNYVAVVIVKVGSSDANEVKFHGWVQSIASDQWTIGGPPGSLAPSVLVKITPETAIYPDPKVGDTVTVLGTRDSSGAIVAASIRKDEDAPSGNVELRGVIALMAPDRWVLTGPWMSALIVEVRITPETVVYPGPKLLDKVIVSGTRDGKGVVTALKIVRDE